MGRHSCAQSKKLNLKLPRILCKLLSYNFDQIFLTKTPNMQQVLPALFVGPSERGGRGVFTSKPIPKGSIIEVSPVIVLPGKDRTHLDKTQLHDYYFIWGEKDDHCALVLGYGSLYNHDFEPNAEYRPDFEGATLDFYALQDIPAGTEVTVNYSGDPGGRIELWFEPE